MAVVNMGITKRFIGLSTDTKPTGQPAGSTIYLTDSKEVHIFDGTNWQEYITSLAPGDATKLGYLTVTANTDLDTIRTTAGHITVTGAADLDQMQTDITANDTAIGNRTYTEQNYVTDAQTVTASVDALDMQLNVTDAVINDVLTEQDESWVI